MSQPNALVSVVHPRAESGISAKIERVAEIITTAEGIDPDATYTFEVEDKAAGEVLSYVGVRPQMRERDVRFDLNTAEMVVSRPVSAARG